MRQRADGRWGLAYDPGIAVPFRQQAAPPALWSLWDAIKCPTLVVRGTRSNVLSEDVARRMVQTLADGRLMELDAGHNVPLDRPRELADATVVLAT